MGRAPCCEKIGLKKGPWTPEEDQKLVDYIHKHGYGNWRTLPKNAGLQRCGKSCRLRWTNYLRPDIKRGKFSFEEEEAIIQLHSILGNKWSAIAARLPGRTDNEIKNYWNTHIRKRLLRMGIDPFTHSPRLDLFDLSNIFNATRFYNTCSSNPQMNLSSLVNPELLTLLAQMRNDLNPFVGTTQFQAPIQNPIPNCTKMTTTSISNVPCFGEAQIMEPIFEEYPTNVSSLDDQNLDQWQSNGLVEIDQTKGLNCYGSDRSFMDPYYGQQSVMSSAPLNSNSNSTNVNGSGTDDERESYCSDVIKFDFSDILDVSHFILAQSN